MHMLYNSASFAVVLFEVPTAAGLGGAAPEVHLSSSRGGYEIVDKLAGKETFISGSLAESFKTGVEALIRTSPSEEEIDDYIEGFSALMQQPLVLH
jgi:hypothetical protein